MIVNLISVIFILFTVIASSNQNENCNSNAMCLECSENEIDINGNAYCLKCDEKQGYIGIAGTCIPKEDFPSKKTIENCQSYFSNIAYCAVCDGNNHIEITKLCVGGSKDKYPTKWIILICVLSGIFLIGFIVVMVILIKKKRKKQYIINEKENHDNEIIKNNEKQNINEHNNIQSDNLPLPQDQVSENEILHVSDKYNCSKNGCNGKAVIKSDCNCGYLCLEHANSFYNSNNLDSLNGKRSLNIKKQQCKKCNIGFITEIKKISKCESCGIFEFLELFENNEICEECKGKKLLNNL